MTVSNVNHVGRGERLGQGGGSGVGKPARYSGADSNERGKKKKKLMVRGLTEGEANTSRDVF